MIDIKPTSYGKSSVCCDENSKEYYPTVYINGLPAKLVEGKTVGEDCCVVLYGKLREISSRETDTGNDQSTVDIEVHRADMRMADDMSDWEELIS